MARLPQPGADNGNWGVILNDYLSQTHNTDGSIKSGVISATNIADGSVSTAKLANGAVTAAKLSAANPSNGQVLTYNGTGLGWSNYPMPTPIVFSAATATTGVTATDRAYATRTLTGARMRVAAAPIGSPLSVAVQHYDGLAWSTLGSLTIAAGSTVEAVISFTQTQAIGDLVRLNITSVGSSTPATGVAVDVIWS